jgi:hypothetical protein
MYVPSYFNILAYFPNLMRKDRTNITLKMEAAVSSTTCLKKLYSVRIEEATTLISFVMKN